MAKKNLDMHSQPGNIQLDIKCQSGNCRLGDLVPLQDPANPDCKLLKDLRVKSHNYYFRIFDDLPFPMWHANIRQKYAFFNRAWLELTGKRLEDEIGDRWMNSVHPEDVLRCQRVMLDAYRSRTPFEREYRVRRYDGEYRWIADIGRPCYDIDGNFAGYIGTCYDITEHKAAEEEVQKLTQFLELVIDSANVWLSVFDEKKRVVIWNKAAEMISGYTREQVAGNDRIWEWLYPETVDRGEITDKINEIMEHKSGIEGLETAICTNRNDKRIISWNLRAIVDKKGKMVGTVVLGRDITESKRAGEQLLQAQKMDAIGQLAGGIAHELNNEMSIIQGYVDINIKRVSHDSPLHKALLRIRSAVERAAHLTHQLMLSSRKQPQNKEPMNLNQNIREMQEMLEWFTGKRIKLKLDLAPDLWMINGDAVNIDQVITNLALNARDAMPHGGTLTLKTCNVIGESCPAYQEEDALTGRYVCLAVSDTGTGMDDNVKAHLFEPFFTTKERGKGTGLGLSVAYGIIEAHGGYIDVKSAIGQGSTFYCYLPAI